MHFPARIGTWNLAAKWDVRRCELLLAEECDIWLLTEVLPTTSLPGFVGHFSIGKMAQKQHWAGVFSRLPLNPLPDPHMASAAARIGGITYCSTILPWRDCGPDWGAGRHAERTAAAIEILLAQLPRDNLVWGADWNHAFVGRETAGSNGGRESIKGAMAQLRLNATTTDLPHWRGGATIDHIAVPDTWKVEAARCVPGICSGKRLSDHDIYVIDVLTG